MQCLQDSVSIVLPGSAAPAPYGRLGAVSRGQIRPAVGRSLRGGRQWPVRPRSTRRCARPMPGPTRTPPPRCTHPTRSTTSRTTPPIAAATRSATTWPRTSPGAARSRSRSSARSTPTRRCWPSGPAPTPRPAGAGPAPPAGPDLPRGPGGLPARPRAGCSARGEADALLGVVLAHLDVGELVGGDADAVAPAVGQPKDDAGLVGQGALHDLGHLIG